METATTPEGFLGSRVDTEMTFAGGARMEVSIRLRKGGGVAEGSMVTLREVGRRGSVGIRLEMLKALIGYAEEAGVGVSWRALPAMTLADAKAVADWAQLHVEKPGR